MRLSLITSGSGEEIGDVHASASVYMFVGGTMSGTDHTGHDGHRHALHGGHYDEH